MIRNGDFINGERLATDVPGHGGATRCAVRADDVALAKLAIEQDTSLRGPSYRKADASSYTT